eukprot:3162788-Pyramimonas_sp.AAC.1
MYAHASYCSRLPCQRFEASGVHCAVRFGSRCVMSMLVRRAEPTMRKWLLAASGGGMACASAW